MPKNKERDANSKVVYGGEGETGQQYADKRSRSGVVPFY